VLDLVALRPEDLGVDHPERGIGTVAAEDEDGGIRAVRQSLPLHENVVEAVAVEVAAGDKPDPDCFECSSSLNRSLVEDLELIGAGLRCVRP
jgi:hypothetical protein